MSYENANENDKNNSGDGYNNNSNNNIQPKHRQQLSATYYDIVGQILRSLESGTTKKFSNLKSDVDRFKYVHSLLSAKSEISNYIHRQQVCPGNCQNFQKLPNDDYSKIQFRKDKMKAKVKRLEGNDFYKNGKYQEALNSYNEAVLLSPWPHDHVFRSADNNHIPLKSSRPPSSQLSNTSTQQPASFSTTTTTESNDENDEELALSLANRSAVYMKLENFVSCLDDLNRSINSNYPPSQLYKLYERKLKCFEIFCRWHETEIVCKQLKESLKIANLKESLKVIKEKEVEKIMQTCKLYLKNFDNLNHMHENIDNISKIHKAETVNTLNEIGAEDTSSERSFITIYNSQEGRDMIATDDIKTGQIIMSEETEAKVLHEDYFKRKCYRCFQPLDFNKTPVIPCKLCSLVAFCSEQCQELCCGQRLAEHGEIECRLLSFLLLAKTGNLARLALRVVLMLLRGGDRECVRSACDRTQNENSSKECRSLNAAKNDGNFISTPSSNSNAKICEYDITNGNKCMKNEFVPPSLFNLVSHSDKRQPNELFQYSLLALFIVQLLDNVVHLFDDLNISDDNLLGVDYFKQKFNLNVSTINQPQHSQQSKKENLKIKLGSCLLTILQIITCNGIEINETQISCQSSSTSSSPSSSFSSPESSSSSSPLSLSFSDIIPTSIGLALYSNISMFNHSCFPDADFIFQTGKCIVRCIKPIEKGKSIRVDYGYLFYAVPKPERKKALKEQYYFDCQCKACLEDWPTMNHLKSKSNSFSENLKNKLSLSLENYENSHESEKRVAVLESIIDEEVAKLRDGIPSRELIGCLSALKKCYRMSGDVSG
ncbi:hypothetical protein HELRODRAFT_169718 [Helobdella robusta]|uniref:SET domain-containing protein n=1 Tax=Helobdella robusta TaxID=6412 RepID=T1F298_HELRO|nr:hypothetical protein HELRODRAFT_169718 [Helobdella robusta]ESO08000.1 hypothetical protein HELRODRAFT_169718 [Helobdella robusta]